MQRIAVVSIVLAVAVPAGIAAAQGGDQPRQTASYDLSQKRTASSTAEHFVFDYVNPDDPAAKPPAVKRVTTILPKGARYDTAAPEQCTASDAELMAAGGSACPEGNRLGGGVITVDTGFPGPGRIVTADTEFFNNEDEFIYLNTVRGSDARTVIRAEVTDRRTVTEAPILPGTPPDGGAIDTVDVTVDEVSREVDGEVRNYITTPRRCPKDRTWTAKVRFEYGDGYSQTTSTENRCRKPKQG
jgi:hypothetical protein